MFEDVRFSLRRLAGSPGFAATTIAVLAIGLAAAGLVGGLAWGLMARPLPYPDSERLVDVATISADGRRGFLDELTLDSWAADAKTVDGPCAYSGGGSSVRIGDRTFRVGGAWIAPCLLPVLGVRPLVGGGFRDEAPADDVVMLSHGLWQRAFGGDEAILDRSLEVDGRSRRVVGVMPSSFAFPGEDVDVWLPLLPMSSDEASIGLRYLSAVARLRSGVDATTAAGEGGRHLEAVAGSSEVVAASSSIVVLNDLRDEIARDVRPALGALIAAVGFLLLATSANLASLQLARGVAREKELAIRSALGAPRRSIVRLVLIESLILAVCGGIAGGLLAIWVKGRLLRTAAIDVPRVGEMLTRADGLVIALALAVASGLAFGLLPAFRATRRTGTRVLLGGHSAGGDRGGRLQAVLVVVEFAVAMVLTVTAGLLGHSFLRILAVDPGFSSQDVVTARIEPSASQSASVEALYRELVRRVEAHPAVEAAGLATSLPPANRFSMTLVEVVGAGQLLKASPEAVSPGFFTAMRIPLEQGVALSDDHAATGAPVILVNETLLREHLGGEWRGKQIATGGVALEIIGVVADVRILGLDRDARPTFYFSYELAPQVRGSFPGSMALAVRGETDGDSKILAELIRDTVKELDPHQAIEVPQSMEERLAASLVRPRFYAALMATLAGLALVLCCTGTYGTLALAVSSRTRELGVRRALGATTATIVRSVLARALRLIAGGLVIGGAVAWAVSRGLQHLLFATSSTDPGSFSLALLVLVATGVLGGLVPALRAARVDPNEALRLE